MYTVCCGRKGVETNPCFICRELVCIPCQNFSDGSWLICEACIINERIRLCKECNLLWRRNCYVCDIPFTASLSA